MREMIPLTTGRSSDEEGNESQKKNKLLWIIKLLFVRFFHPAKKKTKKKSIDDRSSTDHHRFRLFRYWFIIFFDFVRRRRCKKWRWRQKPSAIHCVICWASRERERGRCWLKKKRPKKKKKRNVKEKNWLVWLRQEGLLVRIWWAMELIIRGKSRTPTMEFVILFSRCVVVVVVVVVVVGFFGFWRDARSGPEWLWYNRYHRASSQLFVSSQHLALVNNR